MNDDEKDKLIFDLLSNKNLREGEACQKIAHAMASPIRGEVRHTWCGSDSQIGNSSGCSTGRYPEFGWQRVFACIQ